MTASLDYNSAQVENAVCNVVALQFCGPPPPMASAGHVPFSAAILQTPKAAADVERLLERGASRTIYPLRASAIIGPVRKTRNSVVFRGVNSDTGKPLAIKFCVDPMTRQLACAEARRQFTALERVAAATNGCGVVSAPRPIMLLEDQACIVMEWVQGLSLADILTRLFISKVDIAGWSWRVGAWLSAFHQLNPKPSRPTNTALLMKRLELAIGEFDGPFINPVFAGAVAELRRAAPLIASQPLPAAWRHGDFKAQNLMITNNGLVVLDLDVGYEDVVTADVAKFVSEIEFLSWFPQAWRLRRDRDLVAENFLAGYNSDRSISFEGPVLWSRLYRIIRFWLQFETTGGRSLKTAYQRHCFKTRTRRLTVALSRHLSTKHTVGVEHACH